ncbi:NDP-hexose 2,3-dehydratase family protein [Micromonospora sp. LOL_023]|uniref:NDP-hexose 2,3-dehydratase family protein n=1 Tax=Micromonospora sp. LOL_023 TaxID=3345418 RepID=UPI003A86CD7E
MFRNPMEFNAWLDDRRKVNEYHVVTTSLDRLDNWLVEPHTGNLRHRTGRFFSIEGLRVSTDNRETTAWDQPIIVQPETGVLGVLVKDFDGAPHCLLQAKMEPGNINLLQLSPTVQATHSNHTRVHQGAAVPYLEQFLMAQPEQVIFDSLQSEQGSWFLRKRNRNMIVRVDNEVPTHPDFCWLSLPQIAELLQQDNLVNMDTRTVLSGMSNLAKDAIPSVRQRYGVLGSEGPDVGALHTTERILGWLTAAKTEHRLDRELIPLEDVRHWDRDEHRISHEGRRYFTVMGVDVRASNREVAQWSQPMVAPIGRGVAAFLGREIDGVFHVLAHALTEAGTFDVLEIAPTVQCIPNSYLGLPDPSRPKFLDYALNSRPEQRLLDVVHSEEGGRFYHAETRYLIVDTGDDLPLVEPPGFLWVTLAQLGNLVRFSHYLNVTTRSLLTCVNSWWWNEAPASSELART